MSEKARSFCPEHKIEIRASRETIWRIITDFNAWQEWNPLYVESQGKLAVGETIQFAVALPGLKPHRGTAEVIAFEANKSVQYQMLNGGILVKPTRYIEISEVEPGRCILANGEIMQGLLGPVLFLLMGKRIRQGLEGMNKALKEIAEQA